MSGSLTTIQKIQNTFGLSGTHNRMLSDLDGEIERFAASQGKTVDQVLGEFKQAYDGGLRTIIKRSTTRTSRNGSYFEEILISSAFLKYRNQIETAGSGSRARAARTIPTATAYPEARVIEDQSVRSDILIPTAQEITGTRFTGALAEVRTMAEETLQFSGETPVLNIIEDSI